ncbi:MAG: PEP-CTERM sorting domain-containing protein [Rhodoferax sp.]|nr:PEP-CTERM sorting domain-containing protein [Rhodoferax sp.]
MKTHFKTIKSILRASVIAVGLLSASSAFALALPTATSCGYPAPNDNLLCYTSETGARLYVGSSHDDFISYSVNALDQYASKFGYTSLSAWSSLPPFGSGQIVKLFSFNNSNNGTFPDATTGTGDNHNPSPTGDQTPKNDGQYYGDWPVGSVVTVAQLKAFLGAGYTTPVFAFDLNNTTLQLNGYLQVRATGGVSVIDTFGFDNITNSDYDPLSLVTALAAQTVTWYDPLNTSSGCDFGGTGICTMVVDNNVGSGKPDFFAYAPTFNLYNYADTDELYFTMYMNGLVSGGEELALTNVITSPNNVPEPGVLSLLGLGLVGIAFSRRKSRAG